MCSSTAVGPAAPPYLYIESLIIENEFYQGLSPSVHHALRITTPKSSSLSTLLATMPVDTP